MVANQASNATNRQGALLEATSFVELANGVTLPYIEQGNAEGLPVVLVHGFIDSWRSWETVLPSLPDSLQAIAMTQRGHGDADRPVTGYGVRDFAADLSAFIDALDLERIVVVGHSLGSLIAQRFTMDHPERVLGLVLIGSATTWRGNPVVEGVWEDVVSTLSDPVDPDFVRDFQDSPRLSRQRHEVVVQESLKVPARVMRATLRGILEADFSAELSTIQAPTLIIWGDEDPLCPYSDQQALNGAIAGSQLTIYSGSGHNPHWEDPERFAADLVAFVDRINR